MTHPITVPKLGLTMEEATLVSWHIPSGQRVTKGATLFSIETDKISFDVEAEADGYVDQRVPEGDTVLVGAVIGALLNDPDELNADIEQPEELPPPPPAAPPPVSPSPANGVGGDHDTHVGIALDSAPDDDAGSSRRRHISPLARRIAASNEIAMDELSGSGANGVILKRDVERVLAERTVSKASPVVAATPAPVPAAAAVAPPSVDASTTTRQPLTAMRRAISTRMSQSLASTAQMTGFGKVDMTEMTQWRTDLVAALPADAPRITYTDIVTKACAGLLREMPEFNSYIDGDEVVAWKDVHIGIAVAVDGGLLVPVIHHADRLSLRAIAARRTELIDRARTGRITPDDMAGGTFTVSNFGSYGGDFETPILNAPQSALLGIGGITDEAVVRDKQIVIRAMMMLSLTFDHRLIDGAVAGRFRARLRELLEIPPLMLALMG